MKRSILSLMYLIQGMRNAGIDIDEKLMRIGLKVDAIDLASAIDINLEREILKVLCSNFSAEQGLKIGQHYTLEGYGPLLMLLISSPYIEIALHKAIQYCQLTHLTGTLNAHVENDQIAILYQSTRLTDELDYFLAQCEIAGTFKFLQSLYQIMDLPFPRIRVELPFELPSNLVEMEFYQQFYGMDVCFGAPEARFWFSQDVLKVKIPSFDEVAFRIYEQKCIDELSKLSMYENKPRIVQRVMDYLVLQNSIMPTMTETAQVLNMPERTLRHQLQQHQTSYKKIREEIIKNKALEMMEYKKYSIEMISELLGYSEPAAFNHAFKRWFGQSPRQYLK
ncbi:AraC family transcriptional regulator [Acinetobacter sp. ANC 4558]|uniref:helix-turn-helix domain-containing protein n=1 Tax=Acinetobacter sp. ANC 4558 TaxID=1977876 RepID=UPI000A339000|nr:AraC family transcriptional regulator [Acinetobacter sp. ANC 4558]OTG82488.1 AraC family transcriptional regulator [Acinetobacter sp. ANC 4558]